MGYRPARRIPDLQHSDLVILVLRRDHALVRDQLRDWDVHAADPPGTLRPWPVGEIDLYVSGSVSLTVLRELVRGQT
jgi:hypothetical protein